MYLNVEGNFTVMCERQPLKKRGAGRKGREHTDKSMKFAS